MTAEPDDAEPLEALDGLITKPDCAPCLFGLHNDCMFRIRWCGCWACPWLHTGEIPAEGEQ